ncbi:hypothetical protein [Frigoriglobus tundricola]|uniref:Beta-xylosidase C-terminal Concanavalin A-like domain-containing protein n=1 Tax=Frigoriglobus tundricola TaxID=2774151 RepID=A0A6M5Z213_9BACT|nr:hypothetical protein [Frigoriglobus tundricola]QJW99620.1 hypothetical protein FTUN_7238 [Frigoriglobus tundricola]
MIRAATVLASLSVAAAFAAPVPPPTEKERFAKEWGKTYGASEFELRGKQLMVRTTTGKPTVDQWQDEVVGEPRTALVVKGEFEITVRVLDVVPPRKDAKNVGVVTTFAGLYLEGPAFRINGFVHQFYDLPIGAESELKRCLRISGTVPGLGLDEVLPEAERGQASFLRMHRKGNLLTMSNSIDGKKWTEPKNPFAGHEVEIPDALRAGVFFGHSTSQFGHATFDRFTVEKPMGEKAK